MNPAPANRDGDHLQADGTSREAPIDARSLSPEHEALIAGSAISREVARERTYFTVNRSIELSGFGWNRSATLPRLLPALAIPVRGALDGGRVSYAVLRPDSPRTRRDKAVKYEVPPGRANVLDVPPRVRDLLDDPSVRLWVTESVRKADALVSRGEAAVSINGVWGWRGRNGRGGRTALPDWEVVGLNGREVIVAFDSDVARIPEVAEAAKRLGAFLGAKEVRVRYLRLDDDGVHKCGVDDALAGGMTISELRARLQDAPPAPAADAGGCPYRETASGMVWLRPTPHGPAEVQLANFVARIVADITIDDGVERRQEFEVEVRQDGRVESRRLSAAEFSGMTWPVAILGARGIVSAGLGLRDHSRAAIQHLSSAPQRRTVITHTGWHRTGAGWVYLHGTGALGGYGPVRDIEVELPRALSPFVLVEPATQDGRTAAVRSVFEVYPVAPDRIMLPLLAAVARAIIGGADFSIHLAGRTGAGKTELAAIPQSFFGSGFDSRNLPASWSSTANALEELAFVAQDAVLVVDDFAPSGARVDVARLHRDADRLLRAQGNRAGRARMGWDRGAATARPPHPPRGLIVSTGEDVPEGLSLRARILVVEVAPGDVSWPALSAAQQAAASGAYAGATASFIRWLAPRLDSVRADFSARIHDERQRKVAAHLRTNDAVAQLQAAWAVVLHFAAETGALSVDEAAAWEERGRAALDDLAAAQAGHQAAADPALRFLDLLRAAVASGEAHLASRDGGLPADGAGAWGWRSETTPDGGLIWRPPAASRRVGWVDGDLVLLEPEAAVAAARMLGERSGGGFSVGPRTLHKRLHERGWLAEQGTDHLTVVRQVEGRQQRVLVLEVGVCAGSGQIGQGGQDGT